MEMMYRSDRPKGNKKTLLTLVGLVVCVGVCAILFRANSATFLQSRASFAYSLDEVLTVGITKMTPKKHLLLHIRDLRAMHGYTEVLQKEVEVLREENATLKAELGVAHQKSERILAGILLSQRASVYHLVLIDRGEQHGVVVGAPVYGFGNARIGIVHEVFATSATITLFSHPQTQTTLIHQKTGTLVTVVGEGGVGVRFTLPRDVPVAEKDALVAPGVATEIAGIVQSVVNDPREPVQTIIARLPINPETLRFVEVGTNVVE